MTAPAVPPPLPSVIMRRNVRILLAVAALVLAGLCSVVLWYASAVRAERAAHHEVEAAMDLAITAEEERWRAFEAHREAVAAEVPELAGWDFETFLEDFEDSGLRELAWLAECFLRDMPGEPLDMSEMDLEYAWDPEAPRPETLADLYDLVNHALINDPRIGLLEQAAARGLCTVRYRRLDLERWTYSEEIWENRLYVFDMLAGRTVAFGQSGLIEQALRSAEASMRMGETIQNEPDVDSFDDAAYGAEVRWMALDKVFDHRTDWEPWYARLESLAMQPEKTRAALAGSIRAHAPIFQKQVHNSIFVEDGAQKKVLKLIVSIIPIHTMAKGICERAERLAEAVEQGPRAVCEAAPGLRQGSLRASPVQKAIDYLLDIWWGTELLSQQHDVLRTARAVNQYRSDHGALPENLEVLVPEYLDSIPCETTSGAPFILYHEEDHALLMVRYIHLDIPGFDDEPDDQWMWRFYKEPQRPLDPPA
jgi:hypothetical protein